LDGLRGIAVLLVVVGHAVEFSAGQLGQIGSSIAQLGVLLFFVLSGFLITGLLQREQQTHGKIDLKAFYARRTLRLGPALLVFLAVTGLLAKTRLLVDIPKYEFVVCLIYTRNIFGRSQSLGHLWSLSLEEQLYTFWPSAIKFFGISNILPYAATAAIAVSVARTTGIAQHWLPYETGVFYMRPWFRFDSILIGCCTILLLSKSEQAYQKIRAVLTAVPTQVLWAALLGWTILGEAWSKPSYITLQTLLSGLAICQLAITNNKLVIRIFSNQLLRYFGKISYSLYLWQQIFLVVREPAWCNLRNTPQNMLLPLCCAVASFHIIEAPALRLKRHFQR